jgi:hypothetical protein
MSAGYDRFCDRTQSYDRDRPWALHRRAPRIRPSRSSLELRYTIGAESAQTRHMFATTVRAPWVGGG